MKTNAEHTHQWIRSACLTVIAASSLAFVYCYWQGVKAQRAQAVALVGVYDTSTQTLIKATFARNGMGESLNSIYTTNTQKIIDNI